MREWQSQAHVKWYCRYHVVIVPKYRRKSMYGAIRKEIGKILKELCRRYEIEVVEGHVMPDYIHMCLGIPPKYSVANTIGKLKGKSAIHINQKFGRRRNVMRFEFWARVVLCQHSGIGRSRDTELHPNPKGTRDQGRSVEYRHLTMSRAGPMPPYRGLPQTTRYAGST